MIGKKQLAFFALIGKHKILAWMNHEEISISATRQSPSPKSLLLASPQQMNPVIQSMPNLKW